LWAAPGQRIVTGCIIKPDWGASGLILADSEAEARAYVLDQDPKAIIESVEDLGENREATPEEEAAFEEQMSGPYADPDPPPTVMASVARSRSPYWRLVKAAAAECVEKYGGGQAGNLKGVQAVCAEYYDDKAAQGVPGTGRRRSGEAAGRTRQREQFHPASPKFVQPEIS
jgi:hypothetical protein